MKLFNIGSAILLLSFFNFLPLIAQVPSSHFEKEKIDDIEIGYGLEVGDVDGDGTPDIILADKKQFVWYENGSWQKHVMVENLTERDNVCLAARDINGDGQVEIAVGARWNPGETSDTEASGSVHYLIRPEDPRKAWEPVALHHEPTIHRMRWMQTGVNDYQLIVVPLHGRGNKAGQGRGVKLMAYQKPDDPSAEWDTTTVDQSMHMTHNFAVDDQPANASSFLVAGREGVNQFVYEEDGWHARRLESLRQPAGEISLGNLNGEAFITTIEPMHGNRLMLYKGDNFEEKTVLFDQLKQGHALAAADILGMGKDQIIVGWREPNEDGKVGIKIFIPMDKQGESWMHYWIDENGMACEDLKVADLDDDGDLDIVAAGRATENLKIYWNKKVNN